MTGERERERVQSTGEQGKGKEKKIPSANNYKTRGEMEESRVVKVVGCISACALTELFMRALIHPM